MFAHTRQGEKNILGKINLCTSCFLVVVNVSVT